MDVLRRAYADDEDEHETVKPTPPKRLRSDSDAPPRRYNRRPPHVPPTDPPLLPGRYVSKRERAARSDLPPDLEPDSTPVAASPVVGSISDSGLPFEILRSIRQGRKEHEGLRRLPSGRPSVALDRSAKAINVIQWSQNYGHLLASAGMDSTVRVWNVWNRNQKLARIFSSHNTAVKDVRWSPGGLYLLSCGYDCSSRFVDVEKGTETQLFKEDQVVEAVRFHPSNPELFLSAGSKGSLKLWDIRVGNVVKEYLRNLGPILDIEFSMDGKHFISSTDISGSNASENAIIVWDVSRQIPLSNQVYTEAYTCPCIRYHPYNANFIAQSNGNYIAIFSARPPFKLDRYKRYEKHTVSGFPIKCNFSLDGEEIASGSADGHMYFYSYKSSMLLRKIKAFNEACVDVAYHPSMPNVVASCSWEGNISVFE